ncbi:MAG TPA: polysaccharide biosynthesis tyrosine autokinase [Deltaproteobacteria bacterium]|nr:polysaccharide biosynthesis tyrosine autokinase [Deltaproteobacteria bacterium]
MKVSKALEKKDEGFLNEAATTGRLDDHLYMHHMPYSYTAEQIRKLRTFLFHMEGKPIPRVIMITSALPGEGKSLIASNLAISIAKGDDQYVLLVECDLRKPSLSNLFKYPPSKGVSEIIQGNARIEDCLIKTPINKLTILPAAKEAPPNPSELLESKRMSSLIKEMSERYTDRFLIIDTPPIQATVDPKIIADQVEAIVMVSRYRYTKEADFKMALENLPKDKIVGSVLNAIDELPAKKYKYRKYSYHKYY